MTADATRPIAAATLSKLPNVAHGFFTREGGVSAGLYASLNCGVGSGDERATVLENRARAAARLGLAGERLVSPYQVHGAEVVTVTAPWSPDARPEADAMVTDRPGIAIAIGTADCAPVLFADAAAGVVGAAHAGWGGAIKGVLEATVTAMVALGAEAGRIAAAVGPAIAQASYEVGPEFRERFLADDPANARFFVASDKAGHFRFDLTGYVVARLEGLGLASVAAAGLDTYTDEGRFFSFRRTTHRGESDYGRMISAIALK